MEYHRAESYVEQAHQAGIRQIVFNGGEPMLHASAIRSLIRQARNRDIRTALVSNGYWGSTKEKAFRILSDLRQAGLQSLTLSTDRFHLVRIPLKHLVHILLTSRELHIPTGVKIARLAQDPVADGLYRSLRTYTDRIHIQGVSPLGRASLLRKSVPLKQPLSVHRPGCLTPPVLLPSGHVLTCCNLPARDMDLEGSPLVLGSLEDKPLSDLLEERTSSPILAFLRKRGPVPLLSRFQGMAWRSSGMRLPSLVHDGCDLCFRLFRSGRLSPKVRPRSHQASQGENLYEA